MSVSNELPPEVYDELLQTFDTIDNDGNGFIELDELQDALEVCGYKMARYQVRDLIEKYDVQQKDGKISFAEFNTLYNELRQSDFGANLHRMVKSRSDLKIHGSRINTSCGDVKHTVRMEEQVAFSDWLNRNLAKDNDCQKYLPFKPDGDDLYSKCRDGILLCKVINCSSPGTIDERVINKGEKMSVFQMNENLTLALNSAQSLGCVVVSIGASDIGSGTQHLILGLLWQIIKVGLLSDVNVASMGELRALMSGSDTLEEMLSMAPEQLLMKWVNYHLEKAGSSRRISNFSDDVKDSEAYAYLLDQIVPAENRQGLHRAGNILQENDRLQRAELVLQNADLVDARVFVQPSDIVAGNGNLNMAFVANLFHKFPHLESAAHSGEGLNGEGGQEGKEGMEWPNQNDIHIEETREEKTYRNWMNSMGLKQRINYLYVDLRAGLTYFELYDLIWPGIVNWSRVQKVFKKMTITFQRLENCNYVVEIGKRVGFSLVGIGGEDLVDGNVTLTLALVWQLMRAYTLAILTKLAPSTDKNRKIDEKAIIQWANDRLKKAGKTSSFTSFHDPTLCDGKVVLDLIDSIKRNSVDYSQVTSGTTEAERLQNSKLAISLGWKAGAKIYALPEDIVDLKYKMIMTVFACLMQLDFELQGHSPRENGDQ